MLEFTAKSSVKRSKTVFFMISPDYLIYLFNKAYFQKHSTFNKYNIIKIFLYAIKAFG